MKNKANGLGKLPTGLVVIRYIYAIVALFTAFAAVFLAPQTSVYFCGKELDILSSMIVNGILVLFPLILYLGFIRPTAIIWYLAFLYHIFFIGNSFLGVLSTLLPKTSIIAVIEISGKSAYTAASVKEINHSMAMQLFSIFNITMLLGVFILWYLWQNKEYFMPKDLLKEL